MVFKFFRFKGLHRSDLREESTPCSLLRLHLRLFPARCPGIRAGYKGSQRLNIKWPTIRSSVYRAHCGFRSSLTIPHLWSSQQPSEVFYEGVVLIPSEEMVAKVMKWGPRHSSSMVSTQQQSLGSSDLLLMSSWQQANTLHPNPETRRRRSEWMRDTWNHSPGYVRRPFYLWNKELALPLEHLILKTAEPTFLMPY